MTKIQDIRKLLGELKDKNVGKREGVIAISFEGKKCSVDIKTKLDSNQVIITMSLIEKIKNDLIESVMKKIELKEG